MKEQLQYIAELLEQIRSLMSVSRSSGSTVYSGSEGLVIRNTPLPVVVQGTLSAVVQGPLEVRGTGEDAPGEYLTVRLSDGESYYVAGGSSVVSIRSAVVNVTYTSVIVPPQGVGKKIRVLGFLLNVPVSISGVKFQSGVTDLTGVIKLPVGQPVGLASDVGLFETGENESLRLCIWDGSGCIGSNRSLLEPVTGFVTYRVIG